jgi:hypothetical protein
MFFVRIQEWDWPDAPTRVPIIPADLPRQDRPLPKALDDGHGQTAVGVNQIPLHGARCVVCDSPGGRLVLGERIEHEGGVR